MDRCACLLLRLKTEDVAMFRFLLEAYDNLAMFTVLERRPALLKVFFPPDNKKKVLESLTEIGSSIPLIIEDWPE